MPSTSPGSKLPPHRRWAAGFSLAELAIVLVIVSLLTGGLLVSLGAQQELQQIQETRATLATAREALTGFAAVNGRLPCPATGVGNSGVAAPEDGNADCQSDAGDNYFLPAVTLGIGPTDDRGYLLDAWGNRIRYRVTKDKGGGSDDWVFTRVNGPKTIGIGNLSPDLQVCSTRNCSPGSTLAKDAVAVLFSTGRNGGETPAGGTDEAENRDGDKEFVHRVPGPDGAATFDDIVIWLSPNILYGKMLAAGQALAVDPIP